jgi:hypothetical protein
VLHQQMVNEKLPLAVLGLLSNPKFVFGDIGKTIMLAEISKFLIYMATNITAVDNPYLYIAAFIYLSKIR